MEQEDESHLTTRTPSSVSSLSSVGRPPEGEEEEERTAVF